MFDDILPKPDEGMWIEMESLKTRFEKFISRSDRFESIDELLKGNDPHGKKRADYLLSGREVIIEQKILQADPLDKPQKFVNKLMEERHVIAYGTISTGSVFAKMQDSHRLQRNMLLYITKIIDDDVAEADKQTRDTRDIFSIPNSVGLLVFLNEKATILDPELIGYCLSQIFAKKSPDGSPRYAHNSGVILITEAHYIRMPQGNAPIFLCIRNPNGREADKVFSVSEKLMAGWAEFNGSSIIRPHPSVLKKNPY